MIKPSKPSKNSLKKKLDNVYERQDRMIDELVDEYSLVESSIQMLESVLESVSEKRMTPFEAGAWERKWDDNKLFETKAKDELISILKVGDINAKINRLRDEITKKIHQGLKENFSSKLTFIKKPSVKGYLDRISLLEDESIPWIRSEFKSHFDSAGLKYHLLKKIFDDCFNELITSGEVKNWFKKWENIKNDINSTNIKELGFSPEVIIDFELKLLAKSVA